MTSDDEHPSPFRTRFTSNLKTVAWLYWKFLKGPAYLVLAVILSVIVVGLLMAPLVYGRLETQGLNIWTYEGRVPDIYWIAQGVWVLVVPPLAGSITLTLTGDYL